MFTIFSTVLWLVTLQYLAAVPWILTLVVHPNTLSGWLRKPAEGFLFLAGVGVGLILFTTLPLSLYIYLLQDRDKLEWAGRIFGSVLHLQLVVDFFIVGFFGVLLLWPKGGAVALAAFREGVRQPMYWLLFILAFVAMGLSPFIPYFTFGEDTVMVKELGFDTIMFVSMLFGVLSSSMSISEEIEGRTAVTLMSKPVSRRQFLLGKFLGIFLAAMVMVGLLSWFFNWVTLYKMHYDDYKGKEAPGQELITPESVTWVKESVAYRFGEGAGPDFVRGVGFWGADTVEYLPGFILCACQVMILLGVAVALATRFPMVVTLVITFLVFLLGHLSPVLNDIAKNRVNADPNNPAIQMLSFMGTLFYNVLPGLEFFSMAPALAMDNPPPLKQFYLHIGQVSIYGIVYTSILLIIGLLMFEDRDLA